MHWMLIWVSVGLSTFGGSSAPSKMAINFSTEADCKAAAQAVIGFADSGLRVKAVCIPLTPHKH